MRVVLDLQGAQGISRDGGIGRYTLSLARAVVRQRGEHEILLVLNDLFPGTIEPIRALFDGELPRDRIRVWQAPGPIQARHPSNAWRRATAARIRDAFIASLEPDLVHLSEPLGGYADDIVSSPGPADARFPTTVSLYDLVPLLHPALYLAPEPLYERHFNEALAHARRADGWLTISESTSREALDHLGLDPDSVVNISAACDPIFTRVDVSADTERDLRARFGLTRPFVLSTGGADPRKNLDRLIQAYARLEPSIRRTHQLVVVGKLHQRRADALQVTALASGLGPNDVRITDCTDDEDLVILYNLCELFVLPSLHEGFGLPALEAMACGAPVVGANATSLPEVIEWPEAMFDPLDVASMRAKMEQALTDEAFRTELVVRGTRRAQSFSWDETAKRAIAAFERFHDRRAKEHVPRAAAPRDAVAELVREVRAIPGNPRDRDLVATARAITINHPETSERRLIVDVSSLIRRDHGGGIQRVVRSMVTWLPTVLPAGCRLELAYATLDGRRYRHADWVRAEGATGRPMATDVVLDPRPGDVFLGLDLHYLAASAHSGFYSEFRRLGIPVYFVVYDLLPVLLPHRFPPAVPDAHMRWLQVVAAADGALCISRAVASELRSWVEVNGPDRRRPLRIGSFHLGADIKDTDHTSGMPDDAAETLRLLEARPTFLVVGTLEPRKGHGQTLDAFERLWDEQTEVNLAFVGKNGWLMEPFVARLQPHPEIGKRLFWMEGISDQYLVEIYRAATCVIAPSEGEGFGLPLIEAAQHRTPLLVRDIPVFREVAGDCATYFDGRDGSSLANAVREWLTLWRDGLHPRSDAMPWLTWEASARQLVAVLFDEWSQDRLDVAGVA